MPKLQPPRSSTRTHTHTHVHTHDHRHTYHHTQLSSMMISACSLRCAHLLDLMHVQGFGPHLTARCLTTGSLPSPTLPQALLKEFEEKGSLPNGVDDEAMWKAATGGNGRVRSTEAQAARRGRGRGTHLPPVIYTRTVLSPGSPANATSRPPSLGKAIDGHDPNPHQPKAKQTVNAVIHPPTGEKMFILGRQRVGRSRVRFRSMTNW